MYAPRSREAAPTVTRHERRRLITNAAWLLRLRWVAVVGQLVTIGISTAVLRVELPLLPLSIIVGFTAVTNIGLMAWHRWRQRDERTIAAHEHRLLGVVMTVDLLSLSALLFFAGGASNPFAIFYFVNLALSAVILPAPWGWTLTLIAIVCMVGLLVAAPPIAELTRPVEQAGLLVAFATSSVVVVYFITRLTGELRQRDVELRNIQEQRSRSEKLEALGTLAAGAGHELATPLSTIAVVAKELTLHLQGANVTDAVIEDVALIRSEVNHCRTILDRMTGNFDQERAEASVDITCADLIEHAVSELLSRERVRVACHPRAATTRLHVPLESISQAIRGVLQNALDASNDSDMIDCRVAVGGGCVEIAVEDRGTGMSEEVITRAGEPFFTTKQPGEGMGLGLFLTRSVVERLGGSLELQSEIDQGVTAIIRLPVDAR